MRSWHFPGHDFIIIWGFPCFQVNLLAPEHKFSSKFLKHISNLRKNLSGFDFNLVSVEGKFYDHAVAEFIILQRERKKYRKSGDFESKALRSAV